MLLLTRKLDERIRIGDSIVITVVHLGKNRVKLGVAAPEHFSIRREQAPTAAESHLPAETT